MTTKVVPQAGQNTDRELWRERDGDYYADSIHVTIDGRIGINCGGLVFVKTVREWHKLAKDAAPAPAAPACVWARDGDEESDTWATGCGRYFTINEGNAADNGMTFCAFCGRPIGSPDE